jgi:hypothetical protein
VILNVLVVQDFKVHVVGSLQLITLIELVQSAGLPFDYKEAHLNVYQLEA